MGQLTKTENCRWRRRKDERPSEILSAALKSFSSKGFTATKLDDVAKHAGVSKGTLYLYFESKEALFNAVVSEFVLPQIEQAEDQAKEYKGLIKDLILKLIEQWRINVLETDLSGIPKIMIAEASNFPELANFYINNVIKRSRTFISNLIQLGIDRGEFRECDVDYAARAFFTPMVFTVIWKHSLAPFDDKYDVNEYLSFHVDVFLKGITKDSGK